MYFWNCPIANTTTENQIEKNIYYEDSLCSRTYFIAFAPLNDSVMAAIENDAVSSIKKNFIIRSFSGSTITKFPLDTNYSTVIVISHNTSDTSFIASAFYKPSESKKIVSINSQGNVTDILTLDSIIGHPLFQIFNNSYYYIQDELDSMDGSFIKSNLFKYSYNGIIKKLELFEKAIDFEITSDGKILLLCDKSKGDFEDISYNPIRIFLSDTNLNILSYKDFGFSYVTSSHITLTLNSGFIVTGTLMKDLLDTSLREPNQIYFLKSNIDSIDILWTNNPILKKLSLDNMSISQNPFTSQIKISSSCTISSIEIYNILGEKIYYSLIHSSTHSLIDLSSFPNSIYFLTANINQQFQTFKIIKM